MVCTMPYSMTELLDNWVIESDQERMRSLITLPCVVLYMSDARLKVCRAVARDGVASKAT